MSQMKPIASHDQAMIAELRETAEQEEELIEQLEKATRALWRARRAKHALAHLSVDLPRVEQGC